MTPFMLTLRLFVTDPVASRKLSDESVNRLMHGFRAIGVALDNRGEVQGLKVRSQVPTRGSSGTQENDDMLKHLDMGLHA